MNSSEEAEALACQKAIEFSIEAGFSEPVIKGDSLNVMRAISALTANNFLLGHIYKDICCYISGLQVVSIRVERGGNMVSHSFAKYVKNIVDEIYWLEDTPPPAVDAVYWDFLRINE